MIRVIKYSSYACNVDAQNDTDLLAMLESRSWTVTYTDLDNELNTSYTLNFPANRLPPPPLGSRFLDDIREDTQMKNNEFFETSVRHLSRSTYFFPANQLYEFRCNVPTGVTDHPSNYTIADLLARSNETICEFDDFAIVKDENRSSIVYTDRSARLKIIESNYIDRLEKKRRYLVDEILPIGEDDFKIARCRNPESENRKVSLSVALVNWTESNDPYRFLPVDGCAKRCVLTAPRAEMCSNMETVVEYNVVLTFWLYLAIRVFIGMIGGTAFAMFEGAVIAILREQEADYGMQRIYGSIGGMISSPLSGLLIDYASRGKSYTDFR